MSRKRFGVFKLILLCGIVAIISAIPVVGSAINESDKDKPANCECVITIWNVDTFESGSASKTVFLESASLKFSKLNRGVYFLVKNLTVEEMENNFNGGFYPDMITFGYGIGEKIIEALEDISGLNVNSVRSEILNSGKKDGLLYAVGFLMGGMILATTEEKLMTAGLTSVSSVGNVVNIAGYDKELKKEKVHISSVIAGKNGYVNITKSYQKTTNGQQLSDCYLSENFYDAYADFVSYNKGTILLGTHRDLYKLSGRIAVGKINNVKIEYLSGYTNLIQYAGVVKGLSTEKKEVVCEFIEFLLTDNVQKLTTQIGMVNTIGNTYYESGEFMQLENALNDYLTVESLF